MEVRATNMSNPYRNSLILISDPYAQTRNLLSDVLRGARFDNIMHAADGEQLVHLTEDYDPRIVITTSRIPKLSGLEYTRLVRAGYKRVSRSLSIIVMTNTPTKVFLDIARDSGVDEIIVRPFTAQAIIDRVFAVLDSPREFIDAATYIGPCRRRRTPEEYGGPFRRFMDPTDDSEGALPWESDSARQVVRMAVQKISEGVADLSVGDRKKLREVFMMVKETQAHADETRDALMAAAARSLARYIQAVGAAGMLDQETVKTHIDAMHTLGMLPSGQHDAREKLVQGLQKLVDKKLGRIQAA